MSAAPIRVHTLVTGSFVANGYIVHREGASDAILIDPGAEPERWEATLEEMGLTPRLVMATHAHLDHVGAVNALVKEHGAAFALHADEVQILDTLEWQCRLFGLAPIARPPVARMLRDRDVIDAAGIRLVAIHTPGHTPGGIAYHLEENAQLFTGDSLFAGTIGRSDLPGGDHDTLIASLHRLTAELPAETVVLPGHGPATTIGRERDENPFLATHT